MRALVHRPLTALGSEFSMVGLGQDGNSDDVILDQLVTGSFDENESLAFWLFLASLARPKSLFLDVGAFTGVYALAACSVNPGIKVVAFEPSAVTFGRLAMNVRLSGFDLRVIPANLALSDTRGPVTFPHRYGIHNLCPGEQLGQIQVDHTQTAFAICADELLAEPSDLPDYLNSVGIPLYPYRRVRAVKIDVERHEPQVISGMRQLIQRDRPVLICESLGSDEERSLDEALDGYGYGKVRFAGERNLIFIPQSQEDGLMRVYSSWRSHHTGPLCTPK